jgi:hypothetical protein
LDLSDPGYAVSVREGTIVDSLLILVSFAAASFSFACAVIALFQDRDPLAAAFATGGLWLSVWLFARGMQEPS